MKKINKIFTILCGFGVVIVPMSLPLASCSEKLPWYSDKALDELPIASYDDFEEDHPETKYKIKAVESCKYDSFRVNFEDDSWKPDADNKGKYVTPYVSMPIDKYRTTTINTVVYEYNNNSYINRPAGTKNWFWGGNTPNEPLNPNWVNSIDYYTNKNFIVKHLAIIDRHTNELSFGNDDEGWDFHAAKWLPVNWTKNEEFELYFESCNFDKMKNRSSIIKSLSLDYTKRIYFKNTGVIKYTAKDYINLFNIEEKYIDKITIIK